MIIYEGIKKEFMEDLDNDILTEKIRDNVLEKMKRRTSQSEINSWENSMHYMYKVLNDTDIPENVGIAIEYNIPLTSKRVDFMITGFDPSKKKHLVIIELKQWEKIEIVKEDGLVETYLGGKNRKVVHPSYQAWTYSNVIKEFNYNIHKYNIGIEACSYLHNYDNKDNKINDEIYDEYLEVAPVFREGEVVELRNFIKKFVKYGDNKEILYIVEDGKIKPSKSLQDSISKMLDGNKEFYLLDEQKVIFEEIITKIKNSNENSKKNVFIIKGGPGTGKSVVAINLLADLTSKGQLVQYVSKNSAPRNIYSVKLKSNFKKTAIDNLFKGSGSFIDIENNFFDMLIVDEAHRLNEKSGLFSNKGENQIKEIINASKNTVFFIDEYQKVHLKDIGSVDLIEEFAIEADANIYESELKSQFRCNGSDGYLGWVDNTLKIRETANAFLEDIEYDFQIVNSPNELYEKIMTLNKENNKSRMLAGYCWKWDSKQKDNPNHYDIVIEDFKMSWNLGNTVTYAIDENSIEQVGCIHTSQGLEFDYVGVIIGEDLRYDGTKVITDYTKRASTDRSLWGIKKRIKEDPVYWEKEADTIIRNTYRTLLTRGMKGCYIYCMDKKLAEYLKTRVK